MQRLRRDDSDDLKNVLKEIAVAVTQLSDDLYRLSPYITKIKQIVFEPADIGLREIVLSLDKISYNGDLYRFKRPVHLKLERIKAEHGIELDGDYFLASSRSFLVHATGDSIEEAYDNYSSEWIRHFRTLVENEHNLGPGLQEELNKIRKLLRQDVSQDK